ncbi:patched family protein [Trichuris trichiura]|uniref:Patched family protein n=1 Tax=Trichuris trichiura TaxID=36087 RepID=A0A077Z844_TRITR|nr:patched family protein [Trichuris trichiura]
MRYNYMDLCLKANRFCYNNPQVPIVSQMFAQPAPFGNLSYPRATFANTRIYLGLTLGGTVLDPFSGQIVSSKAWFLIYQLRFQNATDNRFGELWERKLEQVLKAYNDGLLRVSFFHSHTLDEELSKNGDYLAPKMIVMFIALTIFATFCTITFVWEKGRMPTIDWTRSTPLLAIAGVIGAGMGVVSAIGLLSLAGVPFCEVIGVMPFLVISVRLDNTFLMVSSLFHTRRTAPVVERIAEAMSDAAVSITITVLTDILSFGVGYFTSFPAVQLFCIYTCVAMMTTFIYQLTFLLGLLVLHARNEAKGRHVLVPCLKTVRFKEAAKCDTPPIPQTARQNSFKFTDGTDELTGNRHCLQAALDEPTAAFKADTQEGTWVSRFFRNHFAPFLMKPWTKLMVVLLYVLYLGTSLYGCLGLREGLEPVNLLVSDSYAIPFYRDLGKYFWEVGVQVQVTFNRPGNLSDAANRRRIYEVVRKFSNGPHGMGDGGLEFWLQEFEHFLPRYNGLQVDDLDESRFYENLQAFLSFTEFSRFSADVVLEYVPEMSAERNGNKVSRNSLVRGVSAFRLMVGIKDFANAIEQTEVTTAFRDTAALYPQYNITTFHYMWPFVDQYMQILPNVLQEVYSGMACMVLIALLLIPQPLCSVWVTLMIASIDLGVVGYMTLWNLPMDCISMITLIMSIGFSVDFSAHIAYAYTVSEDENAVDRIRFALGSLAWPIIQGGLATVLGVLVLASVNSYMVNAFFKTVLLVIIVGVSHGIIFLPVLLSIANLQALRTLYCETLSFARSVFEHSCKMKAKGIQFRSACSCPTHRSLSRPIFPKLNEWYKQHLRRSKSYQHDQQNGKPTVFSIESLPNVYR